MIRSGFQALLLILINKGEKSVDPLPNQSVPPPPERKSELRKPFLASSGALRVLKMRNLLVLGVIILVSGWLAVYSPLFHKMAPAGIQLTDLHSVKQYSCR